MNIIFMHLQRGSQEPRNSTCYMNSVTAFSSNWPKCRYIRELRMIDMLHWQKKIMMASIKNTALLSVKFHFVKKMESQTFLFKSAYVWVVNSVSKTKHPIHEVIKCKIFQMAKNILKTSQKFF